ncbi:MAG: LPS assembly lipoprotein LptE [Bryobacterales bacterium]|nr:LPS assembly lipoprotein LptE [Bryobacterales bacterium]
MADNRGLRQGTTRRTLLGGGGALAAGLLSALAGGLVSSCGYRVAGKADTLPTDLATIAIPAFENLTTRYRLTQWMPEALGMEFLRRSRYQVVAEPAEADAVLRGAVLSQQVSPLILDASSGRASMVQLFVRMQIRMEDRRTGRVLYQNDNMDYRARYEIAVDQRAYFDESDSALERLSQEIARSVVSRILEGF